MCLHNSHIPTRSPPTAIMDTAEHHFTQPILKLIKPRENDEYCPQMRTHCDSQSLALGRRRCVLVLCLVCAHHVGIHSTHADATDDRGCEQAQHGRDEKGAGRTRRRGDHSSCVHPHTVSSPTHHPSIAVQYTCAPCAGAALPAEGELQTVCTFFSFSCCASLLRSLLRLSTLSFIGSALVYTPRPRPHCVSAIRCTRMLCASSPTNRVSWQSHRVHAQHQRLYFPQYF
ncbi:hypothetical protein B0H16DRAFT_1891633 [Mycena metata]|uniref:Uncharacterized protein n=1 Tax=Mycena metata TaxID=1033252 RepID=A0AAD7IAL1_9AGAR|nr:hypothetical protein B0H16DRAFT_1891633 [Mycena metata]